jgi:hypothetical protein
MWWSPLLTHGRRQQALAWLLIALAGSLAGPAAARAAAAPPAVDSFFGTASAGGIEEQEEQEDQEAQAAREAGAPAGAAGSGVGIAAALRADGRQAARTFSLLARREVLPHGAGWWGYLGGLAAASAVLESDKEALRRQVLASSFYRHSRWTDIGGQLGLSRNVEAAAAAFYVTGLLGGCPKLRETGLLLGESVLAAQAATGAINFAVSEQRPRRGGTIRYFHTGGSSASIHMTNTMALARVLDHQVPLRARDGRARRAAKMLAKAAFYGIPAITGWQRLRSDQHYLWNVVLGAGASFYMTSAVLRASDRQAAASTGSAAGSGPRLAIELPGARLRGAALVLRWDL